MSTTNVSAVETQTVEAPATAFEGESDLQFDSVIGMTAADALREGANHLQQVHGDWGNGTTHGCALTACYYGVKKAGYA